MPREFVAPLPFPHFNPVLLQLGPLAIRWYALAYIAGIMLGWRYAVALVRNARLWAFRGPAATPLQIDDMVLWITLGVIVGGRLGHVIFYTPSLIWRDPVEILKTWHGGMSFHGGALGVLVAGLVYCWRSRLDALRVGDVVTAAAPIGLFFGRIANFINGELWGRPTSLPWGIIFPNADPPLPRHPSQLYEAGLEGLLLFAVLSFAVHRAKLLEPARRGHGPVHRGLRRHPGSAGDRPRARQLYAALPVRPDHGDDPVDADDPGRRLVHLARPARTGPHDGLGRARRARRPAAARGSR